MAWRRLGAAAVRDLSKPPSCSASRGRDDTAHTFPGKDALVSFEFDARASLVGLNQPDRTLCAGPNSADPEDPLESARGGE